MPSGKQRYPRTKMVLPLRVWLDQQKSLVAEQQLAHTLDISPIGGRLGGLRTPVEPGQVILLQHGQKKSQFRVIWSRELEPREIHAGVESMESGKRSGISTFRSRRATLLTPERRHRKQGSADRLRAESRPWLRWQPWRVQAG